MQAVRFIVSRHGGQVRIQGRQHDYPPDCLVVTGADAIVGADTRGADASYFDVQVADFRTLYPDVLDLLDDVPQGRFQREPLRIVGADHDVLDVVLLLAKALPVTLLRFAYVYCLGLDRHYFSALLRHTLAGDQAFSDFIQANYLNQWSVVRFAEAFDMPLRKFNILFQGMYGMTAKRWLLEQRLQHARGLLLSTPMRVKERVMKAGQLDAVTPFLAMHGIAADTAYFGRGEVVIGRRIQLPALRLVYRQEAEQLLVCDLAASVPGSGSRGAVMAFLQLIRLIAAGVPRLRLVRGLLLDSPSDPELNRTRARLSRILEARGACWRQIDGERWLVCELPLSADAGKASHPCR